MNAASRWRTGLARDVAPLYAANPNVAAVLLGGSTARGRADRFSDIELGVFWHRAPEDDERRAAAADVPGDLVRLYPYDPAEQVWCDDFTLGRARADEPRSGVLLEIAHHTTDFVERTLRDVLERHDPDPLKQNLLAGIVDGRALHDDHLVREWKERAGDYPEGLTRAVVRRHAQIDHFWRWEMWCERSDNRMMLYGSWSRIQQQLLHVLLGLNRVYYSGFKWLDVVEERLERRPADLVPRLARVYRVDPAEGARILAELVDEVYDQIERELPGVDVDRLRSIFRYRRPLWDQAPPA